MSRHERRRSLAVIGARYRRIGVPGVCYYCGAKADTLDHVPPVSLADERVELEELSTPHWAVVSCRECNSTLSASPLLLLSARRAALLRRYRAKYARELAMPEWSRRELAALGYSMRTKVLAGLAIRDAVRTMLSVLEREVPEPGMDA